MLRCRSEEEDRSLSRHTTPPNPDRPRPMLDLFFRTARCIEPQTLLPNGHLRPFFPLISFSLFLGLLILDYQYMDTHHIAIHHTIIPRTHTHSEFDTPWHASSPTPARTYTHSCIHHTYYSPCTTLCSLHYDSYYPPSLFNFLDLHTYSTESSGTIIRTRE